LATPPIARLLLRSIRIRNMGGLQTAMLFLVRGPRTIRSRMRALQTVWLLERGPQTARCLERDPLITPQKMYSMP